MRHMKLATGLATALALASCGPGSSENVMSSSNANAFSEEQVDLALGDDISANAANNAVTNNAEEDVNEAAAE